MLYEVRLKRTVTQYVTFHVNADSEQAAKKRAMVLGKTDAAVWEWYGEVGRQRLEDIAAIGDK